MPLWLIVIGIMLFAAATSVLYVWGMKKSFDQRQKLANILYNKCANKVLAAFKKNDSLSSSDIEKIIATVKASEFYSRQKAVIQNPKTYSKMLSEKMYTDKLISKDINGSSVRYIPVRK